MKTYYDGGGWQVTDSLVRTPKKSFSLDRLEAVSLKRSFFLLAALPATGALTLTALWWRYLYAHEIWVLILASLTALLVSFQFGTLKVDALSLKDDEGGTVYGRFTQLARVRDAIETAMRDRNSETRGVS